MQKIQRINLRDSAKHEAEKIYDECELNEVIIYVCRAGNDYHVLDEKPSFLKGN